MRLRRWSAYFGKVTTSYDGHVSKLKNDAIDSGLVVNMVKTKYIKCSRNTSIETHVNIEGM
jgi:hypothetical protein